VQSPQQPVGQYGASGYVQQSPIQQHTPTQPYGASWDQAQAAARLAQQQGQPRR
jgi:CCR4-NOT transcriptional complex subunit CAF120